EDEWIELYNRSPYSVDLSSLTLYSKTDMSPYIKLSGTLSSGGYYLIEAKNTGETDEATQSAVKDIPADLWTSFGVGLSDAGENLILAITGSATTATSTVDEISYCLNWCGGTSSYSYERYSPDLSGSSSSSWSSNYGLVKNGVNVAGVNITGTPKARNSLNYLVNKNSDITSDLTLRANNSPYIIDNRTTQIIAGKTLTLEPGVVLKFNMGKISAVGNVVANGTADNPIVFTTFADDTYGGDTDGVVATPVKGTWFGVELYTGSTAPPAGEAGSSFDHTIFRYGGNYGTGTYKKAMLYAETSPTISNSIFEYSKGYGVSLKDSGSIVSGNTFRYNTGTTYSMGLYALNGIAGSITNNTFSDNGTGLSIIGFAGNIKDNTFTNNTTSTFILYGPFVGTVSGNGGS
ncbi:MAG: right-handed parallel beta-helix repeat-containing protein, partial [Patescibacteria group bacterium]